MSKIPALNKQVGGDHYKGFGIQPVEFSHVNGLSFLQGEVVKRICRYNVKGGKGREDLEKIIHEVQILMELEYPESDLIRELNDQLPGTWSDYD